MMRATAPIIPGLGLAAMPPDTEFSSAMDTSRALLLGLAFFFFTHALLRTRGK